MDVILSARLEETIGRLEAAPHRLRHALLEERQRVEDLVCLIEQFCKRELKSVPPTERNDGPFVQRQR